jgi:hypothetical protein
LVFGADRKRDGFAVGDRSYRQRDGFAVGDRSYRGRTLLVLAVGAVSDREKPRPNRNTKHSLGMIAVGDRSYRGRDGFAVGDRSY